MRLLFFNHLENAVEALRANRLRTVLTTTGVTIGVASIVSILSLAGGASEFLDNQVVRTRDSVALVRSSSIGATSLAIVDTQPLHTTSTLTEKDAEDISRLPNVKSAPMAVLHSRMTARDDVVDAQQATLIGTNHNMIDLANLEMFDGQFLRENGNTSGIVIGNQLAIDLFGTEHALGNMLTIRDQSFTVIGVLKATHQPINHHGVDFDSSAMIHLSSLKSFTQNVAQIQQIVIEADEDEPLAAVVEQVDGILSANHLAEQDYVILTGSAITTPNNQLFTNIVGVVVIIAGISLLVGGIGIMNIMLVNVAERRREVGIRKAIGATQTNIISQFLIESTIIGFLGGLFGYLIGLASAFVLGMYLPFNPVINWQIAAISIGIALVTGVLSGVYPAVRAAKKDPIESLHY